MLTVGEEAVQDDRYVIRAELPALDPDEDIEVTVDGRTLMIHAERRQEDGGPDRSEFRYGSLTRSVRLPDKIDANDVTARYEKESWRSASRCPRQSRTASGSRSRRQTDSWASRRVAGAGRPQWPDGESFG
jgi:hypothetical protein